MILAISLILSLILVLTGVFVFVRDPSRVSNKVFFFVCLFSALWAINFQNIGTYSNIRLVTTANAISFILGACLMFFVASFTHYFPKERPKTLLKYYGVLLLAICILSPTKLINGTVARDKAGDYVFTSGPLGVLYVVVLALGVLLILRNLILDRRKFQGDERIQAKLVGFGFVGSFITGIFFSTVIPIISPDSTLVNLAPFSLVFLVGFAAFAILKHRLFDFRAALARAVTYLFTTIFVAAVYVLVAFFFKRLLLPSLSVTIPQLISNMVLSIILILLYPSLKKRFDRITNQLFFRDAYDPQVFLDELNKTLVTNVEIKSMLANSAQLIESNLKAQFCSFFINDTSYFKSRLIGDYRSKLTNEEIEHIKHLLPKIHQTVIFSQSQTEAKDEVALIKILREKDIEIFLRIKSTLNGENSDSGYLLVGPKQSGNLYGKQDLKILEIIGNELSIAIENALRFEEIEQFNVTLQEKVNTATRELRRTNEKLKALDEAKDEFISMASHQLRTPLTSVKGYLSMLDEGDAGKLNANQKQFVNQAFVSSQRMVYLIADLLNVSRLKTGKFIIEATPTYLPDVVESEIAQLYETVKSRGLTMTFHKPNTFTTLLLDETKIRQVIMNFTDNAIYYTPKGGEIVLNLEETPTTVSFTVTDNGIGVPKSEQHHLFTKFYRAGNARKSRPDGTGLGLFMAQKVVVAQGGAIIFKTVEGKGSTFGFSFAKEKLLVPNVKKP